VSPVNSAPTVDVSDMRRRFDGDDGLVREVARECLLTLPGLRARLDEAVQEHDIVALVRSLHTLRGALLEVSAHGPVELVMDIEQALTLCALPTAARCSALSRLLDQTSSDLERLVAAS
jgi:hypothetical protein